LRKSSIIILAKVDFFGQNIFTLGAYLISRMINYACQGVLATFILAVHPNKEKARHRIYTSTFFQVFFLISFYKKLAPFIGFKLAFIFYSREKQI
jgi:hypothetical protein